MRSTALEHRLEVVYPSDPFTPATPRSLSGLKKVGRIGDGEAYASESLQSEVKKIRARGGLVMGAVYHGTRSSALAGIALHKAILSSQRLLELGFEVSTGEISEPEGSIHKNLKGLEDVFACHSPTDITYSFEKEGEYPIVFGIHNIQVSDAYSDGLKLGPRVPLSNIVSMTVPYEQVPSAEAWTQAHCTPQTLVMSREAATILNWCR